MRRVAVVRALIALLKDTGSTKLLPRSNSDSTSESTSEKQNTPRVPCFSIRSSLKPLTFRAAAKIISDVSMCFCAICFFTIRFSLFIRADQKSIRIARPSIGVPKWMNIVFGSMIFTTSAYSISFEESQIVT